MILFILFSRIVINEVMSNPKGSESGSGSPGDRNEFIEIYNTGPDTIDISFYKIADNNAKDTIIKWDNFPDSIPISGKTRIPPYFYGVILDPEYVDTGDGTYFMPYHFTDSTVILRVGNTTIGDGLSGNDYLYLIFSPTGETVDVFSPDITPPDGKSIERGNPELPFTGDNEFISSDPTGSTPGRRNSFYLLNGIYVRNIEISKDTFIISLKNLSTEMLEDTLILYDDKNRNGNFDDGEFIKKEFLNIPQGDELSISTKIDVEEGVHLIFAKTSVSQKSRYYRVGNKPGDIVINEIMANPEIGCEWIEIYNRTKFDIDITGWMIDGKKIGSAVINKESFIVFANNSSEFYATYGNIPSPLFELPLSFSNTSDSVFLLTSDSFPMDIFGYDKTSKGYSIERINPDFPTEVQNFGYSVIKGGTPGSKNSIFITGIEGKKEVIISPKIFTPDGDGIDEQVLISFPLEFLRNHIDIFIFNLNGKIVRKISFDAGGDFSYFYWDGRDDKGNSLPCGIYVILLRIKDMESSRFVEYKKTVSIGNR
uniref:LTD domain-containing protein n=1 Tax=candidate division WOR-3 bacterium TaxID=2052148 RepID=A0A7C4U6F2_UNCW3